MQNDSRWTPVAFIRTNLAHSLTRSFPLGTVRA
jgi:hypothetical protein